MTRNRMVAKHDAFLNSQEKFAENVKANLIVCKAIAQLPTSKGGGGLLDSDFVFRKHPHPFPHTSGCVFISL